MNTKHHLSIDIETRSSADITATGSYRYIQDPDFRILLLSYKVDDQPTVLIDLEHGEEVPKEILEALQDPDYIKHAYNAAFEWYALNHAGLETPLDQWQCDMIHALYCGYPAGLAATGAAIGLPAEKQKMTIGKSLIRYFCIPRRATRSFAGGFHRPEDDPDKWRLFCEYNIQDVETEFEIEQRLSLFPVPEEEWKLWRQDVRMNAYGVRVDTGLINGALAINDLSTEELMAEAKQITGLDNPNSTAQLLPWLQEHGANIDNIQKATVEEILGHDDLDPDARRVLQLRQLLGKTSIKKYVAMQTAKCTDDRIRGVSQFYGANRTGRYAGRLVQMQNLPRNYLETLDEAREMVKDQAYDWLKLIYGNVPDTLAQLIRTVFIPSDGRHFVVADFSAIEARMIAWLAGEQWVMDVFANNRDIYCEKLGTMYIPKQTLKAMEWQKDQRIRITLTSD